MHSAIKRVLFYVVLSVIFYGITILFVDSRTAFITVCGLGVLIGLTAELIFLFHIFRLPWNRHRQ